MPESGITCGNSTPETGDQAPAIPVKLQTGAISKKIFSMRLLIALGDRARPTNGSDCGSLRDHNLTYSLGVINGFHVLNILCASALFKV